MGCAGWEEGGGKGAAPAHRLALPVRAAGRGAGLAVLGVLGPLLLLLLLLLLLPARPRRPAAAALLLRTRGRGVRPPLRRMCDLRWDEARRERE